MLKILTFGTFLLMTIITDKIVIGGNSLGKIDGKNVFVPYTMPGETLEIEITDSKKDYDFAEIKKIIKPSKDRITPPCRYYGKCGGCNMMHIKPQKQRELRKQMLTDVFFQNGIDISKITKIVYGPDYNYRARFQLNDGGLSQKRSNVVIPVDKCLCAEKPVNDYLSKTPPFERPRGRSHLFGSKFAVAQSQKEITSAGRSIKIYSEFSDKKSCRNSGYNKLAKKAKSQKKFRENHYFSGTVESPENTIEVEFAGKRLCFDIRGFFQSNIFVFEKVVKLIAEYLPGGENVLDMYAGCGSISAFLADKYKNVVIVEHNRDAVVYAEKNLAGKKHVSYGLSGANWVKTCAQYCNKFDACVIDPPRSGMEKEVCDYLCKSGIPHIVLLSCDPATNARDCTRLIKSGYELKQIYLLDFYPNTSHIESLAIFQLR